jgi:hypothetical protein
MIEMSLSDRADHLAAIIDLRVAELPVLAAWTAVEFGREHATSTPKRYR